MNSTISPDGLWRWNGREWEPNIAPATGWEQPAHGAPAAHRAQQHITVKIDNSFAWVMALLPLANLVLLNVAPVVGLLTLAAHIGAAVADARKVRAAGREASTALAILLGIIYLWLRPRYTDQSYVLPIVATVGLALVVISNL